MTVITFEEAYHSEIRRTTVFLGRTKNHGFCAKVGEKYCETAIYSQKQRDQDGKTDGMLPLPCLLSPEASHDRKSFLTCDRHEQFPHTETIFIRRSIAFVHSSTSAPASSAQALF
ncbi:hypothetical protein [Noviherbaspirillum aerium]|uniref:hypothetical protein n=1 Tax=Noviherbaspirillum aerium TaxID=2588497 RepID=UPI00178C4652|nr:hypothetical protein [Noviherbaspirillum aerium]